MPNSVFEFGGYRLDSGRFELCHNGRRLKLERKPLELLILLVTKHGQIVTRDEIAERLWEREVFVDTEHGINTAIRKIRQVLNDNSELPRFVQTVSGSGYRFIAPVTSDHPEITEQSQPALPIADSPDSPASPAAPAAARPHRMLWLAMAVCALLLVAFFGFRFGLGPLHLRLFHRNAAPPITSLAVLPLDNLSGDPSQDYFADGMTDELITMLAKNSTLRVISRTSVMQYKGIHRPLPEIARNLGADGILEGSVARSGNKVHMTLQLIRADTDTHLWAEDYETDSSDVAALPAKAAQAIAVRLHRAVHPTTAMAHVDPEAHDAYLQARYFWYGDNYPQCTTLMQKAIDLQPDYALAWSGLADCFAAASAAGAIPPGEGFKRAYAAASRALELNSSLAEAHNSLAAYYLFHAWDWQRAEAEARRAIELDPRYAEAHHLYSYILRVQNRDHEAFEEQKRATEIDPFSRPWTLGDAYILLHQYDAAIDEFQARKASHSQNYWLQVELARAYWLKGMKRESAMQLKQGFLITGNKASADAVQHALTSGGDKSVTQWRLNQDLKSARSRYVSPITLAFDHAYLGQREQTLRALEDAFKERSPWLVFLQKEPEFDFLHADNRYRALVNQIGLPPAY